MTIILVRGSCITHRSRPYELTLPGSSPSVVVFPKSTEDVVKVVKIANKYKMPVVPYSGATSLEGNYRSVCYNVRFLGITLNIDCFSLQPEVGAICVDVSGMDKILEIHGSAN